MYLALIAAVVFGGMVILSNTIQARNVSIDANKRHSINQAEQYKNFAFVAAMKVAQTPAPSGVQVLRWDDIKDAKGVPSGMREIHMDNNWRVVRTPDEWVICAEMDAAAVLRIAPPAQMTGDTGSAIKKIGENKVIGEEENGKAQSLLQLCQDNP